MRKPKLPWSLRWRLLLIHSQRSSVLAMTLACALYGSLTWIFLQIMSLARFDSIQYLGAVQATVGCFTLLATFFAAVHLLILTDYRFGRMKLLRAHLAGWENLWLETQCGVVQEVRILTESFDVSSYAGREPLDFTPRIVELGEDEESLIKREMDPGRGELVPVEGAEPDTYFLIEDD